MYRVYGQYSDFHTDDPAADADAYIKYCERLDEETELEEDEDYERDVYNEQEREEEQNDDTRN